MATNSTKLSKRLCFKVVDRDGYTVALEKDCWYGHILHGHRKQMQSRLHDIQLTIERADRIDSYLAETLQNRVYWKRWHDQDSYGNEFMKVATEMIDAKEKLARVLTAYPMDLLPPPPKPVER